MLNFKNITVKDKLVYDKYRAKNPINASEGAFTTIFIWNSYYNLQVCDDGEFFFVRFNIKGKEPSYLFPIGNGDIKSAILKLAEYSHARNEKVKFTLVTKEQLEILLSISPNSAVKENRDSSDYVYLTEKMASLSGKKLHAKKNLVNGFVKNNEFEYVKVDDKKTLSLCAKKAYELVANKSRNKNMYEQNAMHMYFENYSFVDQRGAALMINGEVIALTFGEKLNRDFALVQIELADTHYKGAYQTIAKLFCENEWKDLKYVNREEDMGIDGLRKAKKSYCPEFLVNKYTLYLNGVD